MFCSSLRRRRDWNTTITSLLRAPGPAWKEQLLHGYDVAVPLPGNTKPLRIVLMTTAEAKTEAGKARLRCFVASDGTHNGLIMLAMTDPTAMQTFLDLQKELLTSCGVSIMPLPSIQDVCERLNEMRRPVVRNAVINADVATNKPSLRDIASCCVAGPRLSSSQVDILTDITPGLGHLASGVLEPDGQEALFDYLGYEDGNRVLSFFTAGPKPFRD